jgi:hypothetical protein
MKGIKKYASIVEFKNIPLEKLPKKYLIKLSTEKAVQSISFTGAPMPEALKLTREQIIDIRPFEHLSGPITVNDIEEMSIEARWTYEELRALCDMALASIPSPEQVSKDGLLPFKFLSDSDRGHMCLTAPLKADHHIALAYARINLLEDQLESLEETKQRIISAHNEALEIGKSIITRPYPSNEVAGKVIEEAEKLLKAGGTSEAWCDASFALDEAVAKLKATLHQKTGGGA